jgi:hypothetical protein
MGAYWLVLVAGRERAERPGDAEARRREDWVRRRFIQVVWVEHAGLLMALASGLWMLHALGLDWDTAVGARSAAWLRWKLLLVALVVVPFEAWDAWLSHVHLPRLLKTEPEGSPRLQRAWRHHDRLMWAGAWILVIVIPAILILAKLRPQ